MQQVLWACEDFWVGEDHAESGGFRAHHACEEKFT